jgi:hypothetical protein
VLLSFKFLEIVNSGHLWRVYLFFIMFSLLSVNMLMTGRDMGLKSSPLVRLLSHAACTACEI